MQHFLVDMHGNICKYIFLELHGEVHGFLIFRDHFLYIPIRYFGFEGTECTLLTGVIK